VVGRAEAVVPEFEFDETSAAGHRRCPVECRWLDVRQVAAIRVIGAEAAAQALAQHCGSIAQPPAGVVSG
jgi:hypothetical protein